jgi:D-sedoheptulose 7-phosphate isomerase
MTAGGSHVPISPVGSEFIASDRSNSGPGNAKRADLERRTAAYLDQLGDGIGRVDVTEVAAVTQRLVALSRRGGVGYVCGNGGSASTATHFANDIQRTIALGGPSGLRVQCLCDNIATVTAIANDYCYDEIFTRQLRNHLAPHDLVIGISSRGRSPNVVEAIRYARSRRVETIGLVGYDGGDLRGLADCSVYIPVHDLRIVEDLHLAVCHMISTLLLEA